MYERYYRALVEKVTSLGFIQGYKAFLRTVLAVISIARFASAQTPQNLPELSESVTRFEQWPQLRPCCVLGYDLKVRLGEAEVGVELGNVVDVGLLGHHTYIKRNPPEERNGLIYTCRGGVIDIAHVRDLADLTAWLYERIRLVLGSAVVIPLQPEAGHRELWLKAFRLELSPQERDELALLLSQRIAFSLSVWHEIVTWFGYQDVKGFEEKVSAFSPEDLYSNVVGVRAGARALRAGGDFDDAMDMAIVAELEELEPLSPEQTRRELNVVDGIWWDSQRVVPDTRLVLRRNLDVGDVIHPWVVPPNRSRSCRDAKEPIPLEIPSKGPHGIELKSLYSLRFYPDPSEVHLFPEHGTWFEEDDIPRILAQIRQEVRREFGPYGDRKGIDIVDLGLQPTAGEHFDPARPCGADDPDCDIMRRNALHGLHIGEVTLGGGNFPGPVFGFSLVHFEGIGGGFRVVDLIAGADVPAYTWNVRIKAASSEGVILFCRISLDHRDTTAVDYPFVDPFGARCLPGSSFGLKMDVMDMNFRGIDGVRSFRPIDVAFMWNVLGNGHSRAFLQHRVLFGAGIAPESISRPSGTWLPVNVYALFSWRSSVMGDRWTLSGSAIFRDDVREPTDFSAEAVISIAYNALWSHEDLRTGKALHHILTIGIEGGVAWWRSPDKAIPGLMSLPILPQDMWTPSHDGLVAEGMLFLRTSIPRLGLF